MARPFSQVVFGLSTTERLLASTTCCLSAPPLGPSGAPATSFGLLLFPQSSVAAMVLAAASAGTSSLGSAASLGGGGSSPPLQGGVGREGSLFLTPHVLGFTTMLAADLKAEHDLTFKLSLKVRRGIRSRFAALQAAAYALCGPQDVSHAARGEAPDSLLVLTKGARAARTRHQVQEGGAGGMVE